MATPIPKADGNIVKTFRKSLSFGSERDRDDHGVSNEKIVDGTTQPASGSGESSSDDHNTIKSNPKSLRKAFSFGYKRGAGLHGGGPVRWFHNLFPLRQLFVPRVPYPLWDDDW
jgi:hypothetical protein